MATILVMLIALLAAGHTEVKSECLEPQDLAVVLDGSSSLCENSSDSSCPNWDFYRKFIHNIVDTMTIGPDDIRVALVTFSDKAHVEWGFNKHKDKKSLLSAIDKVPYPGGERNTSGALRILLDVFASSYDERPNITTTAIFITDGKPTVEGRRLASAIIELEDTDIITYVVGVTKAIPRDLAKYMSSYPQKLGVNYFWVKKYTLINEVREDLQREVCSNE